MISIILIVLPISAQPSLPNSGKQQEESGVKGATNILNQYMEYFGYYQAVVSGQVGGIIFNQFFSIAMKDADPNTQETITFLKTLKGVLPKKTQGRSSSQKDRQTAQNKQSEIEEA